MEIRPSRFSMLYHVPIQMTWADRVVLYSTVFGIRPKRILEIGTLFGGSTLVMCSALDDLQEGQICCVDPKPQIAPENWEKLKHRAKVFAEFSSSGVAKAATTVGGTFDFALIDGDHSRKGVAEDIKHVLPHMTDGAYGLFHDAFHHDVRDGIDDMLRKYPGRLLDCGMLATERSHDVIGKCDWGGIRILRFRAAE